MELPPLVVGALQPRLTAPSPALAVNPFGALGAPLLVPPLPDHGLWPPQLLRKRHSNTVIVEWNLTMIGFSNIYR
jgi:hypothetical protein